MRVGLSAQCSTYHWIRLVQAMDSKSIYLLLLIALAGIIILQISESVESTDPGPELYPVMPGTNWILCSPLLNKKSVAQAGWSIWLRDEWSWIAGIGRPTENITDSWDFRFSENYKRFGFFESNPSFLQINNVTKEDNGSIYRCRIVTWDGHPKTIYFKLQVLEPKPEALSTTTSAATSAPPTTTPRPPALSTTTSAATSAPPTTTPRPPDHDLDVDVYCECRGWKIGFAFLCTLLFAITVVAIVWKICCYRTADQARRVDGGPEVADAANESHPCVVKYNTARNGIETGNVNYGEKYASKEALEDDDDGDVPMLKP